MSKQREALQMALDTLRGWIGIDEWIWPVTAKETCKKNSLEAITAIREALAEPEQEAAPDLLEALENLADYIDERAGDNECRPLENARAAIAKAKGEA